MKKIVGLSGIIFKADITNFFNEKKQTLETNEKKSEQRK
jgi:hypothetical protein